MGDRARPMSHPQTTIDFVLETKAIATFFALLLAVVHLEARRFSESRFRERGIFSAAGGASVAYVIVLVLPELEDAAHNVTASTSPVVLIFGRRVEVYVVVLLGFVVFYGVDVYATQVQRESTSTSKTAFWVHISFFALYNVLIGDLLYHQVETGKANLVLYALAMGLHFMVADAGLRRNQEVDYDRIGRWVFAGAVVFGAAVGFSTETREGLLAILFAFLAGSVLFNVLNEEIPSVGSGRFVAFTAGALIYAGILLFI